jgi:hypothetical protein
MSEQFENDLKILERLKEYLGENGYFNLKVVEGRGICGLQKFIYTVGLCYGIDDIGYKGRYCYEHKYAMDAALAIAIWDGEEDPAGRWLKYKGNRGEYQNPKLMNQDV